MRLRTTGSRNLRGRTGGGPDVLWVSVTAVGFLVLTALVAAMARSATARWERQKRASRAPRPEAVPTPTRHGGTTARLSGAVGRAAVSISGRTGASRRAVTAGLMTAGQQVQSRVRPWPQRFGAVASVVQHHRIRKAGSTRADVLAPSVDAGQVNRVDHATPTRSTRSRQDGEAILRRTRRRALRFVHRHNRRQDPLVLRSDIDGGPTSR
jgi:hypothetical protein